MHLTTVTSLVIESDVEFITQGVEKFQEALAVLKIYGPLTELLTSHIQHRRGSHSLMK